MTAAKTIRLSRNSRPYQKSFIMEHHQTDRTQVQQLAMGVTGFGGHSFYHLHVFNDTPERNILLLIPTSLVNPPHVLLQSSVDVSNFCNTLFSFHHKKLTSSTHTISSNLCRPGPFHLQPLTLPHYLKYHCNQVFSLPPRSAHTKCYPSMGWASCAVTSRSRIDQPDRHGPI